MANIILLLLLSFVAVSYSMPQHNPVPIPIVSQTREINQDGTYKYSYTTGNNIYVQEQTYLKNAGNPKDEVKIAEGSYQYDSPDGIPVFIRYTSDEDGFRTPSI